jgi:hypothetical protein
VGRSIESRLGAVVQRAAGKPTLLIGDTPGYAGRGVAIERFDPNREAFDEVGRIVYTQMARGGAYRSDRILQRKDGARFWGRLIGQYIDPNDPGCGSIWIVDDIERDKALERELREAGRQRRRPAKRRMPSWPTCATGCARP